MSQRLRFVSNNLRYLLGVSVRLPELADVASRQAIDDAIRLLCLGAVGRVTELSIEFEVFINHSRCECSDSREEAPTLSPSAAVINSH